jgi:NADH:ubiquinone oxidoreductase subunit 5 (subunit L)/multisubunit Na+/H+ antiporter MnhA subunit
MLLIVVSSVFSFKRWYIIDLKFRLFIMMFIGFMILLLFGFSLILVLGWERVRIISLLLIGFTRRSESISSSVAAVLYNRMRDIRVMLISLSVNSWLLIVSVFRKSALIFSSYWLPMAIERPTPVSSLLHSSTIVVAGVFLWMTVRYKRWGIISVFFCLSLLFGVSFFFDLKKNIAYSTSSNLAIIFLMSSLGLFSLVVVHILTHAFIKAGVFIESRSLIHSSGTQDRRCISPLNLGMWILIGVVVITVSKELLVFESRIVGFSLFLFCWIYSSLFNKGYSYDESSIIWNRCLISFVIFRVNFISFGCSILIFVFCYFSMSLIKR